MADIALVEVDRETAEVKILKYVTVHDSGKILNPQIYEGQIYGAFLHGLGGALYEEMAYDENGQFITRTFMDYLVPTFMEQPKLTMGHTETPSPLTVLGSKGVGESITETVPACLANAVTDALTPLGIEINELPIIPSRLWHRMQEAAHGRGAEGVRP
jgi:2-furoyl-CoA dehydrogenase large subunit